MRVTLEHVGDDYRERWPILANETPAEALNHALLVLGCWENAQWDVLQAEHNAKNAES